MHEHKSWIEPLARGGYAARGVVYIVVGALAALAPFGSGEKTGTEGALRKIMEQPYGVWIVYALIVGMFGYVVWRLVQSLLDTDDHGLGAKGLAVRGGLLASGITYALLAVYALALTGLFGGGAGAEGGSSSGPVASRYGEILTSTWVTLGLAAVFLGVAGAHIWKAVTKGYEKHFLADENKMRIIHPVAIIGLIARGLVFAVIALLLFLRYWNERDAPDDDATPGLEDALRFVQDLPAGSWLLAALGVGLLLFAGYSIAEAIWRRINVEEAQSPQKQAAA